MTALRLTSPADAAALAECQYMLTKPLCLVCDDAAVLEQALRVYQGRALYEGALPENLLRPLAGNYGLLDFPENQKRGPLPAQAALFFVIPWASGGRCTRPRRTQRPPRPPPTPG